MSLVAALATRLNVSPWLIEILLAMLLLFGFALFERYEGGKSCRTADAQASVQQEAHNAALQAQGTTTIFQEVHDYHEAIAAPIAHPVQLRVCPRTHEVLPASTPGSGSDEASASGAADHGQAVPSESIGPELQAVGRDGDAQIAALQDYIRKVCLVR